MEMVRITTTEFKRDFGHYQDVVLTEAVTVTKDGRDRMVVMSVEEYERLKRRDRLVLGLADFTEADLDALSTSEPPEEASSFDHEVVTR